MVVNIVMVWSHPYSQIAPVAQWQRSRFVIGRLAGSNPPWGSNCATVAILWRYENRNGQYSKRAAMLKSGVVQGLGSGQTQQTVNLPPCAS